MINVRNQIKEALETITQNVRMMRSEGDITFPLITYGEITNTNVGKWQDRIEYQINGHTGTYEDIVTLMNDIDAVMTEMGWYRTYITPDTQARQAKDFYMKASNYVARVDTHHNYIIGGY